MADLDEETKAIYFCIRAQGPVDAETIQKLTGYHRYLVDTTVRAMLTFKLIYQSGLTADDKPEYTAFDI